jgi:hypothetical protein
MDHRRMVLVPKDKEAKERLDFGIEKKDDLIELYLTEKEYNILDKEGVFNLINSVVDLWIGDYEEDDLEGKENIKKIIQVLEELPNQSILTKKILNLAKEAYDRDTGIYFYF